MSFFLFKSILAVIFFGAALLSFLTMLILMGKADKKSKPRTLTTIHKTSGFIFLLLLLVISYLCVKYWITAGDQISVRASLHAVLALFLLAIFLIKITIAQFFKQFLKLMPVLGIVVFTLVFVVTASSAGYFLLKTVCSSPSVLQNKPPLADTNTPDLIRGQTIFAENCIVCHHADREENKNGPGLKDLFQKEILSSSGIPVTVENVRDQLVKPFLVMPSFKDLTEQEMSDLLAYLQTL